MFGEEVERYEIGPLSYRINKIKQRYTLWLGGCKIGRPRSDKPSNEAWEYSAGTLTEARAEMRTDAAERLAFRIVTTQQELRVLEKAQRTNTAKRVRPS